MSRTYLQTQALRHAPDSADSASVRPRVRTSTRPYVLTSIHPYIHTSVDLSMHTEIQTNRDRRADIQTHADIQ